MRWNHVVASALAASMGLGLVGCESDQSTTSASGDQEALAKDAQKADADRAALETAAARTVETAKRDVPSIDAHFKDAVGYVVFPKIARGGLGIGAANGSGVVYERRSMMPDKLIGTAEVTQVTIGLQIGGQAFSEIIFFQDASTFDNFKRGNVEFNADASGVAGGEGGTAAAKYENGVAVYVFGEKGFMGAAAIGGQKFKYRPAA
jgi:lipid-binding SYLF domain-containing protein